MDDTIQAIPLANLALAFVPVVAVSVILHKWCADGRESLYGVARMLGQLLIIGYFLTYLFEADNAWIVVAVLAVMIFVSSWIALRTVKAHRKSQYPNALLAVAVGGGLVLLLVTQGVLHLDPWFLPQYMIPLAGMIFASSMNSVSLAAERFEAEIARNMPYAEARGIALKASLIPIINSLFAVGLVSLPGMMTGQILSGISPLIAARYQIMVMCMIFASSGISAACFLMLVKSRMIPPERRTI